MLYGLAYIPTTLSHCETINSFIAQKKGNWQAKSCLRFSENPLESDFPTASLKNENTQIAG